MYYTYLLRCGDGSLYAGITTDPARRLAEHRQGGKRGARYTRYRAPRFMEAVWKSDDRSRACKLEALLKKAKHEFKEKIAAEPMLLETLLKLPADGTYRPVPPPEVNEKADN